MNKFQDVYETDEDHYKSEGLLRYYFLSQGKRDIVKAIQYHYVDDFENSPLFNLGFGDYDPETKIISDEEISCNNDQYKVLHTVLNTIPTLFEVYDNAALMVRGSDSRKEFIENCKKKCSRSCESDTCKKAHRRINIYRNFIDKHLDVLSQDYQFWGDEYAEDQNVIEPYQKGKKYKSVFLKKKKP
jgi:hypothetical protein